MINVNKCVFIFSHASSLGDTKKSDEVYSSHFDFGMKEDLSHSRDTIHLFDFNFVLEDDISKLLETFVVNLSYSSVAVLSLVFDFGVGDFFWNYWKLSKETYHILVSQNIHLIWILELKKFFLIGNYRRRLITF